MKEYCDNNNSIKGDCFYCGKCNANLIDIKLVGIFISECLDRKYDHKENFTGCAWDSDNHCYVDNLGEEEEGYCIREILEDKEAAIDTTQLNGNLIEDLFCGLVSYRDIANGDANKYGDVKSNDWVIKDEYYELENSESYYKTWEYFKQINNHYSRFFDSSNKRLELLNNIASYLKNNIKEIAEMDFYRLRIKDNSLLNINESEYDMKMGPPPVEFSKTNRMSLAGIPYLYLSSDKETAQEEIRLQQNEIAVCVKYTQKEKKLKILDLSTVVYIDIFKSDYNHEYRWINQFLKLFIKEISEPVDENISDHSYEYAATQVIAEYFRIIKELDGICFRSSVGRGKNYVFFYGPKINKNTYPLLSSLNVSDITNFALKEFIEILKIVKVNEWVKK